MRHAFAALFRTLRPRTLASLFAAGLILCGIAIFALWPTPRHHFVEYKMTSPQDTPTAIAAAADGTIWFTIDLADAIGRVREGRMERLATRGKNVEPIGVAAAADGSVWYTDIARRAVAHMSSTGETTYVPLDTPIVRLGRLAIAPDGAVWFAEPTGNSITSIKDGVLSRHGFESPRGGPYGVAITAEGVVWATLQSGNQLLRIARDGQTEAYDLPQAMAMPTDIATGPDGAVWFVEFRGNRIGRFRDGKFDAFEVGAQSAGLSGIAIASDGAAWFGMLRTGSIGRLRNGKLAIFRLPRDDARPYSVAIDRAGNVWYADIRGYVGMLPALDAQR